MVRSESIFPFLKELLGTFSFKKRCPLFIKSNKKPKKVLTFPLVEAV